MANAPPGWSEVTWSIVLNHLEKGSTMPLELAFREPCRQHCDVLEGALSGSWESYEVRRVKDRGYGLNLLAMADTLLEEAAARGLSFGPRFHEQVGRLRSLCERFHSAHRDGVQ